MGEHKSKRSRDVATAAVDTNADEEESGFDVPPPLSEKPLSKSITVDADALVEPDVPVISHKAARLAKKRKLSGIDVVPATSTSTSNQSTIHPSRQISAAGNLLHVSADKTVTIGNTPGKSAHGIWLGNMNFTTTNKMLLNWFDERGLKEVTRINMPGGKRNGENNRGFAYIDFPTAVDVEIAVGLSEQHLDGRKLLIKSSSDFTGRPSSTALPPLDPSALIQPRVGVPTDQSTPQTLNKLARKILDRQKNAAGPTLFIGNLGFETTVDIIRQMFDAHQRAAGAWVAKTKGEEGTKKEEVNVEEEGAADEDEDRGEDDSDEEEESSSSDEEEEEEEEDVIVPEIVVDEDADLTLQPIMVVDSDAPAKRVRSKTKAQRNAAGAEVPVVKEIKDLSKAKDAGIRKIRLGTFEDTGKCKGWAFVDFHLPEQCTRALLNVRNHTLDGRNLNVEYASADAVRRGGSQIAVRGGGSSRGGGGRGGSTRGGAASGGRGGAGGARGKGREWDDGDVEKVAKEYKQDYDEDMNVEVEEKVRGEFGFRPNSTNARGGGRGGISARGSGRGGRGGAIVAKDGVRLRPGAALASAQRASEAIQESTGRKTTFE